MAADDEHTPVLKSNHDEKTEAKPKPMVGLFDLFRFSDWKDKVCMVVGGLCAIIAGASTPVAMITFGDIMDDFLATDKVHDFLGNIPDFLDFVNVTHDEIIQNTNRLRDICDILSGFYSGNITCDELNIEHRLSDEMADHALRFAAIGFVTIIAGAGQVIFWMYSAERQTFRIRREFVRNILCQSIGWFDINNVGELNTRMTDDINKINGGLGEKMSNTLMLYSVVVASFIISFLKGWELSFVVLSVSPIMMLCASIYSMLMVSMSNKEQEAYAQAGSVAEEVIGAIRTVVAFGGEDKEVKRYKQGLSVAEEMSRKKGLVYGLTVGMMNSSQCLCYAVGLWYGAMLVRHGDYEVKDMITVFFNILIAMFSLGQASPHVQSISEARGAAYVIFSLIDQKSEINSYSEEGLKPTTVKGEIKFNNVNFYYPSRPDVKVLNGLSLEARPGQTVALVGSSGCGKSTTVQLLLRFYDIQNGQILLDGNELSTLNTKWLRDHIGVVSQEPVLFDTTIAENICFGRDDVTTEEMIEATRKSNAYDFIQRFPDSFQTLVGEGGAQLSGGQKQRIAIARALVRDPKILLLDEATSALDTSSEAVVQDALDKARQGRTTLVIAHRLSTIKTADIIVSMDQGVVVEKGTHDQLMENCGIYHQLVTNQTSSLAENDKYLSSEDESTIKEADQLMQVKERVQNELGRNTAKIDKDVVEEEELPEATFSRLVKMNAPEWYFIVLGCIGSVMNGATHPCFALIFSEVMSVLSEEDHEQKKDVQKYCILFLCIGGVIIIATLLQNYMLAIAGAALTLRIRGQLFNTILRQEMGWFDDPRNSTGALSSRLATDASLVQGATGTKLGSMLMLLSSSMIAMILGISYGWRLTLVTLATFPLVIFSAMIKTRILSGVNITAANAVVEAGQVAVEVIDNMRTVAALSRELVFLDIIEKKVKVIMDANLKKSFPEGIIIGLSQAIPLFSGCIIWTYGAYLREEGVMDTSEVFKVFALMIFTSFMLGQAFAFVPDAGKAQMAARHVFQILDREPLINSHSETGEKPELRAFHSRVRLEQAEFSYPLRPDIEVLRGMNLSVDAGSTVALVGSSGCGKSTLVNLLLRFYDLNQGLLVLGNYNIRDLNIAWLRRQMGIVSQEPVLFNCSIRENIVYGDNSRDNIPIDEVINIARAANIHNFIVNLPHGYDTKVGDKGTQLSGGQRQRIAIARALLRNPRILLLDEATSALDTESEKLVQEALVKARQGRTCITIAHRLSTIKDSDTIYVIDKGLIQEQGSHENLLARKGHYYKLYRTMISK